MSEMLDDILSLENISLAVAKVCSNKGAGGVDGMDVEELHEYMAKESFSCNEQCTEPSDHHRWR